MSQNFFLEEELRPEVATRGENVRNFLGGEILVLIVDYLEEWVHDELLGLDALCRVNRKAGF